MARASKTRTFAEQLELPGLFEMIWERLSSAQNDPSNPWGLPSLATVGSHGPHQRALIVRDVDADRRLFYCYTDARSPKVSQLTKHSHASWLFYDAAERVQLVARGPVSVLFDGPEVDTQWNRCPPQSRRAYLAPNAPGTPADEPTINFPEQLRDRPPTATELEAGRKNFALLRGEVEEMDVLILKSSGNVRASYQWTNGEWRQTWRNP